jgi:hypothetical protein
VYSRLSGVYQGSLGPRGSFQSRISAASRFGQQFAAPQRGMHSAVSRREGCLEVGMTNLRRVSKSHEDMRRQDQVACSPRHITS